MTEPCDVLVKLEGKPATNAYLVGNDRPLAEGIAKHRGRYLFYRCG